MRKSVINWRWDYSRRALRRQAATDALESIGRHLLLFFFFFFYFFCPGYTTFFSVSLSLYALVLEGLPSHESQHYYRVGWYEDETTCMIISVSVPGTHVAFLCSVLCCWWASLVLERSLVVRYAARRCREKIMFALISRGVNGPIWIR